MVLMCPVQLYTHSDDVDAINSRHLAELSGEAVRFVAQDSGNPDALKSACNVRLRPSLLGCPQLPCRTE